MSASVSAVWIGGVAAVLAAAFLAAVVEFVRTFVGERVRP